MKKRHLIIIIAAVCCGVFVNVFVILATVTIFLSSQIYNVHQAIIETSHSYEPMTMNSKDGSYILQTERYEDESGVYASFIIMTQDTRNIVFECPDRYRTMDLKGIYWGDEEYSVVVESGDVGTIIYRYQDNSWEVS